jgi:hypothetical protein
MARKSRIVSATSSRKPSPPRKRPPIPEPFQVVSSATVARGSARAKAKVPVLVLRGEWLKAVGFPIGTAAYLISDKQGELALHRLGLRFPRRLIVRAKPG